MWIFILIVVIAFLAFFFRPHNKAAVANLPPAPNTPRQPLASTGSHAAIPAITGTGDYGIEVVGESNYQPQLTKICGKPSRDGVERHVSAHLVFEDDNKYDKKAVMVAINGGTVGYLDRDAAREFRAAIKKSGFDSYSIFQCSALIRGGWDRGGNDKGMYGVLLDLPEDDE